MNPGAQAVKAQCRVLADYRAEFEGNPAYHRAVLVQITKRTMEMKAQEVRGNFTVIQGGAQ